MPKVTWRVVASSSAGAWLIALAGCGGGGSQQTSPRAVTPPASGPGSVAWETTTAGRLSPPVSETPTLRLDGLSPDRSVLFVTRATIHHGLTDAPRLHALDAASGAMLWSAEEVQSHAVADTFVYTAARPTFSGGDYAITARDARTGAVRWMRTLPGVRLSRLAIVGPNVVGRFEVVTEGESYGLTNRLVALDRETGADREAGEDGGNPDPAPVGPDGTRYRLVEFSGPSAIANRVQAIDPNTGAERWSAPPTPAPASVARDFGFNLRWIDHPVGVGGDGNLMYQERFLYTRAADSSAQFTLNSLAPEDGRVRWTLPLFDSAGYYDYQIPGTPLIGPNGLVYGQRGLNVVAIRTPDTR
jgi:outer membrane protein assembly factor BamB